MLLFQAVNTLLVEFAVFWRLHLLVEYLKGRSEESARAADKVSDFDGSLWGGMVEFVTVGRDKEITVTFRDGTEILA